MGATLMIASSLFLASQVLAENPWQFGLVLGAGAFVAGLSLYREETIRL